MDIIIKPVGPPIDTPEEEQAAIKEWEEEDSETSTKLEDEVTSANDPSLIHIYLTR